MCRLFAVDMDGTLTKSVCWTVEECLNAEPNQKVVDKVNSLKNCYIIINTARVDELIPATIVWLKKHNVKYHGINNQKIPADYYIDDKNISIDDFLGKELTVGKKKSTYIPGGY
jgi:uncharacterized HAD superfamily protein